MLTIVKKLVRFRLAQTSTRGAARLLGFGRLAAIAGLVSGVRAWRKQHHA